MNKGIRNTTWEVRRLSAMEAEVWLRVEADSATSTTELRGRLTGPRCPGVTTVEVAYSLRPLVRPAGAPANTLIAQAIIPEPNMWTEKMPFTYEAKLELWEDGRCYDSAAVSVGLKSA